MIIKNLYRYEEEDGSITITPNRRVETDEPYMYRLIAEEGKILTNGVEETTCIDTHNIDEWHEIDMPEEKNNISTIDKQSITGIR